MDAKKFSAIAHRHHDYCNPISRRIESALDLVPLYRESRVLDLGCGRGELAVRIAERSGARVTAVDISTAMLAATRSRANARGVLDRVDLVEADIATYEPPSRTFDLTVMLGGGGISGGMHEICSKLMAWTRPGGHVLVGEGFWVQPPGPDYLNYLDTTADELKSHHGNVQAGIDVGLIPLHAIVSSQQEWDDYEWKYSRSIELYAEEEPSDPDLPAMLTRIRRWRDAYLRWGRDTLGFAAYLFRVPMPKKRLTQD